MKTFRGRTIDELLPQIRAELGPDAIILREREGLVGGVGGFFAQRFVEVDARRGDGQSIDIYDDAPEDELANSAAALLEQAVEQPRALEALAPEPVDLRRDRTPAADQPEPAAPPRSAPEPPVAPEPSPPTRRFETGLFLERLREASQELPDDGDELTYRGTADADPDAVVADREPEPQPEPEPEVSEPRRSRRQPAREQSPPKRGRRPRETTAKPERRSSQRGRQSTANGRADSQPTGWTDALLKPEPPAEPEGEPQAAQTQEITDALTELAAETAPAPTPPASRRSERSRDRERPRERERPSRAPRTAAQPDKTTRESGSRRRRAEPQAPPTPEPAPEPTNPYESVRGAAAAAPDPTAAPQRPRPRIEPPAGQPTPSPSQAPARPPAAAPAPSRTAPARRSASPAPSPATPVSQAFPTPRTEPRPSSPDSRPAPTRARTDEERSTAGETLRNALSRLLGGRLGAGTPQRPAPPRQLDVVEVRAAVTELAARGASEEWASQLITAAGAHAAPLAPSLREAAESEVARRILAAPALPATGAALAFIGAGGSGKTRCTAALASAYRRSSTLAVTVIALDNPEGARELKRLLRDDQVPVLSMNVERAARTIADARNGGLVIVDTASCTPTDAGAVQSLQAQLDALGLDAVYVALPATLGPQAARRALASFGALHPTAVAVTHADETDQLAVAIEIATAHRIPLAYLHSGTDHRTALAPIEPRDIARHLLP